MKAYNRAQNNMITSANGANNTSMICGMSLTHTADFDNLRELFKNNKNTEQVENLEPIESPKDSIPIIDSTQIILPDSTQLTP